jgi:hypothetical protein
MYRTAIHNTLVECLVLGGLKRIRCCCTMLGLKEAVGGYNYYGCQENRSEVTFGRSKHAEGLPSTCRMCQSWPFPGFHDTEECLPV